MRILAWVIAAAVAIVVIAFAVANRGPVAISVAPFPYRLDIPIWALAVGALAVGFLSGALVRWLLDHKLRRAARRGRRRTRALEKDLARAREKLDEAVRAQRAALPASASASLSPKELA
jgi:uncharacterized integral membrane protein